MKRIVFALIFICSVCFAQTEQSQVIEGGGTGPYKSVAIGDASLPTHMIYRPQNLEYCVQQEGSPSSSTPTVPAPTTVSK